MAKAPNWTENEISILKENWSNPADICKLIVLLNRTEPGIRLKANKLGLTKKHAKKRKDSEKYRIVIDAFLNAYKTLRSKTKAAKFINIDIVSINRYLSLDKELYNKYFEIRKHIEATFICRRCKKEFVNVDCYMDINHPMPHKLCVPCHNKNQNDYRHTLRGALSEKISTAGNRHYIDEIDINFMENMYHTQKGLCYYTNIPLTISDGSTDREFSGISIDRKDSNKGYTKDNVVLCCWGINRMKSNTDYDKFIELCGIVYNKHKKVANYIYDIPNKTLYVDGLKLVKKAG